MDPNSSTYSNHLKASIANLIDNSDETPSTSECPPHIGLGNTGYNYVNGARLDTMLNQQQPGLSLPTTLQPPLLGYFTLPPHPTTLNNLTDLSRIPKIGIDDKPQSVTTGPNTEDTESLDVAGIKKKRGRPRIHPENQKQKRNGVRGRPRSETSQRALKEAAAAAAAAAKGQGLNNGSNTSPIQPSENGYPTGSADMSLGPTLANETAVALEVKNYDDTPSSELLGSATAVPLSQEVVDMARIKRKLTDTATPTEAKQKPKKIKKEEMSEPTKISNTDLDPSLQQPPKSKPTSNSTTPLVSTAASPLVKTEDVASVTKKKRTDGGRRTKKSSSNLTGQANSTDVNANANEDDIEAYCICRRGDNGEWMIGCDCCDDWFHGSCVNLTEKGSSILIKYVCPRCTEAGRAVSIFKRKCRLPGCNLPVEYDEVKEEWAESTSKSKYCSPEHGVEFFKRLVEKVPSQQVLDPNVITAPQLVTLMNQCKTFKTFHELGTAFPATKDLPSEADIEKNFSEADLEVVTQLQNRISALEEKISYSGYRIQFAQQCKERAKLISEELTQEEEELINGGEGLDQAKAESAETKSTKASVSKSKKKKKQQKAKKDICGYNSKLTLEDEEWKQFITSEEGQKALNQEDVLLKQQQNGARQNREHTCLIDKRKCARHNGWQALVLESATDMERICKLEQERLKNLLSELYYKQQVQMIMSTSNEENRTIACE